MWERKQSRVGRDLIAILSSSSSSSFFLHFDLLPVTSPLIIRDLPQHGSFPLMPTRGDTEAGGIKDTVELAVEYRYPL